MKRGGPLKRTGGLKRTRRLPYRSKKTAALYRNQRVPLVKALLKEFPTCQVPNCSRASVDIHEVLRRSQGGSITDRANLRAVCRQCHDDLTFWPQEWMYAAGLLVKRWDVVCEFCKAFSQRSCDPCRVTDDGDYYEPPLGVTA